MVATLRLLVVHLPEHLAGAGNDRFASRQLLSALFGVS
jgi:Fe-S oxidoreductase